MAALPLLLLLAAPLALPSADAKKLPSFIPKCSLNNTNIEKCCLDNALKVLPRLLKGDETLRIPVLDPLKIPEVRVQTGNGPTSFDMHCRNIVLTGLANIHLEKIGIDDKNRIYSNFCTVPRLEIGCDYVVNGRVLLLPIKGSGRANMTFENAVMYYEQAYNLERRDGRDYLKFPPSNLHFNCSRARFNLDNLFDGDQQLGTTFNIFLNENWRTIVDDVKQPLADEAAVRIRQFTLAIVNNVPYGEIFDDYVES